jgi:glycogen debranching enzyme
VVCIAEKVANTERHLDITKNHSLRAEDNADELKKLNKSIFNPSAALTRSREAERKAKEDKIQARYDEERERGLMEVRDTQNRIGATSFGCDEGGHRQVTGAQQEERKKRRGRFQFEATASDDEMEDELDDNLNEISDMTKRLKNLGQSMGQELDNQNQRIDRISDKASAADQRMFRNTERVSLRRNFSFLRVSHSFAAQAHQVICLFPACVGYQKGY